MGTRSKRVRRRTCKRRPSQNRRKQMKTKKRTKNRRAGSNWKCPQTQTVRGHAERLREELTERTKAIDVCNKNVRYLEEYVKNLEASVSRLDST